MPAAQGVFTSFLFTIISYIFKHGELFCSINLVLIKFFDTQKHKSVVFSLKIV